MYLYSIKNCDIYISIPLLVMIAIGLIVSCVNVTLIPLYGMATFLVVVVGHELAHLFAGHYIGIKHDHLVLNIFGGGYYINVNTEPYKELVCMLGGVVYNVVLALIFLYFIPLASMTVFTLFGMMAYMNLVILFFNLLPFYPNDGGRIIRAIVSIFSDKYFGTMFCIPLNLMTMVICNLLLPPILLFAALLTGAIMLGANYYECYLLHKGVISYD